MTLQRLYLVLAKNSMSQNQRSKGHESTDLTYNLLSQISKLLPFTGVLSFWALDPKSTGQIFSFAKLTV